MHLNKELSKASYKIVQTNLNLNKFDSKPFLETQLRLSTRTSQEIGEWFVT